MRIFISVAITIGACLVAMYINAFPRAENRSAVLEAVPDAAGESSGTAVATCEQSGRNVSRTGNDSGGQCQGGPYIHVAPDDVGVSIGPGVIAPYPVEKYTGPLTITSPTTIENVIVDGCLRIESDNVSLRNVVVHCESFYPIQARDHSNARIEYSLVNCTTPTKVFRLIDFRNFVVHRSETRGCEDLFFLSGNIDGLDVSYNFMHSLTLTPESHADGFQFGAGPTSGSAIIRGNYFWPNAEGPKTDAVFAEGDAPVQLLIEDNFFRVWGLRTIRCGGSGTSCTIRNNIYEQNFENMNLLPYGKLFFSYLHGKGTYAASCNRLEDGSLIREYEKGVDRFYGVSHDVEDCPPWPH